MAKRYQPFKEFSRGKKLKLDITINCGGRSPTSYPNNENELIRPTTNDPLWDDDDDDVILLATQVAETQVATGSITRIDETYNDFARNSSCSTSTQQISIEKKNFLSRNENLSSMFEDDDEFEFLAVAATEKEIFKKPAENALAVCLAGKDTISTTQSQTAARRQLASERQIKFLMERVDVLKKETAKLKQDLSDNKYRLESKDGESSLLRDEVRHLKHQIQTLKMEKIMITDVAKLEYKTKVDGISKIVESQESQIKLKDQEYAALKIRAAENLNLTRPLVSVPNETYSEKQVGDNQTKSKFGRNGYRMKKLFLDSMMAFDSQPNEALEYKDISEVDDIKKQRSIFVLEFEKLQKITNAKLQINYLNKTDAKSILNQVIFSICKVFSEFWSYTHSLDYPKNCVKYPYHNFDHCDNRSKLRTNLLQPFALYENEAAISLRRYIACLGVICRRQPPISRAILNHKHGEYMLLQIAIDAVYKLGFSSEICEHFGVLESFAVLLHSLLLLPLDDIESHQLLLYDLLKQLVFCRPNIWLFSEITACFLACSNHSNMLSLFCVNSKTNCFMSDRVRSIYRFSPESCLMQVYAGLLEINFFSDLPLHPEYFELLVSICSNHVGFVYHCFTNPPHFVLNMLPLSDDDCEDENIGQTSSNSIFGHDSNNSTENSSLARQPTFSSLKRNNRHNSQPTMLNCECYIKMCLSVVTLVFQTLRQWLLTNRKYETRRVAEISQSAVHLLNIIFREYYTTSLFRDSEETTKHYFSLICRWWAENSGILDFKSTHLSFLSHLQDSHFMLKPIQEDGNMENPDNDLNEWQRLNNDERDKFVNKLNSIEISDAKAFCPLEYKNLESFFNGINGYAYNFQ